MQSDKDLLQQSQEVLLGYLSSIREKITTSVSRMPPIMRLVFRRLRERIEERWPEKSYEVSVKPRPTNTTRRSNVGPMLGERRRRWTNIGPGLDRIVCWTRHIDPMLGQCCRRWPSIGPALDRCVVFPGAPLT